MYKNEFENRANIVRLSGLRMAPRKVRVVVDQIRNRPVAEALLILEFTPRAAARVIHKALVSGITNVSNEITDWDVEDLFVSRAFVDEGATLRRFRPRAQGRAGRINKRTSHVTIELRPFAAEEEE
jgi:large subunit ribosomal protein L22